MTTTAAPKTGSGRYRIQAIERAVAILNAFTAEDPELGVTDLAERLGLHKSTIHRFLVNLEAAGLVERDRHTSRYRLGLRIFELGGLVLQQMNLWDEALPFLEGLVHDTGETGHLAVLDGGEAVYIEKVEARRALRIPSAIGRGYPAHATSLGKILLAHLEPDALDALVVERGLPRCAPNTITEPSALNTELERIRVQGYAVDDEEYEDGLRCIGAPIVEGREQEAERAPHQPGERPGGADHDGVLSPVQGEKRQRSGEAREQREKQEADRSDAARHRAAESEQPCRVEDQVGDVAVNELMRRERRQLGDVAPW